MITEPWVHVILGGALGYVGYHFQEIEDGMLDKVNTMRIERGLKPFLPGDEFVPYTKPRAA